MTAYQIVKEKYEAIQRIMDVVKCFKVPYVVCSEAPDIKAKHRVCALAHKIGLLPDGKGSLRFSLPAPEFNEAGEKLLGWFKGKRYETYLHLAHIKAGYHWAKDSRNMLTLGFYVGS